VNTRVIGFLIAEISLQNLNVYIIEFQFLQVMGNPDWNELMHPPLVSVCPS
jgi:hypothetical protein